MGRVFGTLSVQGLPLVILYKIALGTQCHGTKQTSAVNDFAGRGREKYIVTLRQGVSCAAHKRVSSGLHAAERSTSP